MGFLWENISISLISTTAHMVYKTWKSGAVTQLPLSLNRAAILSVYVFLMFLSWARHKAAMTQMQLWVQRKISFIHIYLLNRL